MPMAQGWCSHTRRGAGTDTGAEASCRASCSRGSSPGRTRDGCRAPAKRDSQNPRHSTLAQPLSLMLSGHLVHGSTADPIGHFIVIRADIDGMAREIVFHLQALNQADHQPGKMIPGPPLSQPGFDIIIIRDIQDQVPVPIRAFLAGKCDEGHELHDGDDLSVVEVWKLGLELGQVRSSVFRRNLRSFQSRLPNRSSVASPPSIRSLSATPGRASLSRNGRSLSKEALKLELRGLSSCKRMKSSVCQKSSQSSSLIWGSAPPGSLVSTAPRPAWPLIGR